ncbi:MAG: response regulator [Syntrophorhabdaceae bacterium]|nr:response regulator [Syntrophorhabdaceae bacterium]
MGFTGYTQKESFLFGMAGLRVLVIDDDDCLRFLIREWLEPAGYIVEEASDGVEAFEKLRTGGFNIFLTDVLMPKMDGIAFLKKALVHDPSIASVVMSGSAELSTAVSALRSGACDYITKPFSGEALLITIERALHKKELERQLEDYRLNLENKVKEQTNEINLMYTRSIDAMVNALEAKDFYTRGHSQRVMTYSVATAKEMGMADEDVENLKRAAILHDIGKIGVRDMVINKPGELTMDEFKEVIRHPELSVNIIEPIPFFQPLLPAIKHHHERYNGQGYPLGLAGEEIPLSARILSVADTFDAMTSTRPYRKALRVDDAIAELRRCAGLQFDPDVVTTFLSCLPRIHISKQDSQD